MRVCEFAGHEWAAAGGGLLMCAVCQAEKWAREGNECERCGVAQDPWRFSNLCQACIWDEVGAE